MPSVMNANGTMQSVSPDMGSAPGSLCGQSEVLKQVMGVIEKKARNMEKKKVSLIGPFFLADGSLQGATDVDLQSPASVSLCNPSPTSCFITLHRSTTEQAR